MSSAATVTSREATQIEAANTSGKTPVVLIHGLWLLAESWDRWASHFEAAGFAVVATDWPDDPLTVADANANPDAFAGKSFGQVADHQAEVIGQLSQKPVVIGHSFGGALTQHVAGRGLAEISVPIDPAPVRGVLPLPLSALKSGSPVLGNPLNRGKAIKLTADQFRYGFGNAVSADESAALYEAHSVACPALPLFQAAMANLNPWTEVAAKTDGPDRGPMLLISGEKDHTVPWAMTNAAFKRQRRNAAVTEVKEIPNRGHSLTIDGGWQEVADTALTFVQRFS